MRRSRSAAVAVSSLVVAAGLVALPHAPAALAATHPSGIASAADADILGVTVDAATIDLAGVLLGHADASVTSAGSAASGANLGAAVLGLDIPIGTNEQSAPADNPAPSADTLLGVNVLNTVTASAVESSAHARWADACSADGQRAESITSLAEAGVDLLGIEVLSLGASQVTTSTAISDSGITSSASGSIAGLSLLGGTVQVAVDGTATLSATATGSPGPATTSYAAPAIRVTSGGTTVTLEPGGTAFTLTTGLADVRIAMPQPTATAAADGTSASAAVALLDIEVELLGLVPGVPLASVGVDVLPLSATAAAPAVPTAQLCITDPVIEAPVDGASTNDATPDISGVGEPGAALDVAVDGSSIGSTTVEADGTWSITPSTPLSSGSHEAVATQTIAGTTSASDAVGFTIDAAAPDAPVIEAPEDGSLITDATPTYAGTGEPGATVAVDVDGEPIGTTTVTIDGTWSLDSLDPLADGDHIVGATQADAAGNVSPAASNTFSLDATAPTAPVITTPADGSSTSDTTPGVSGTGEPGATLAVTIDGIEVGTALVDDEGAWSLALTEPLAEGTHTVAATQTDAAGNSSGEAANDFAVDLSAPAAPVIETPADGSTIGTPTPTVSGTGEPGAVVTVAIDGAQVGTASVDDEGEWTLELSDPLGDGPHTVTATQADAAGNASGEAANDFTVDATAPAAPVIDAPADGSSTSDSTPPVTGTGEAGATVTVSIDGAEVGTAVVDGEGAWSLELVEPLAEGPHQVTATQADAVGNGSEAASNDFTVDVTAPAAPVIDAPADGSRTNDVTPTVSGTGEPGATVVVRIDGAGGGTAVVDGEGAWSLEPTEPLTDGPHTVTATQTDAAGNASGQASNDFAIDVTAPAAPVIEAPADGSTTDDATPTVSGMGEPGATVTVSVDGTAVGTAVVDGDGAWSLEPTEPLVEGLHTVTAVQTDVAGNESAAASHDFTVDLTAPAAPVIETPADGSTTDDATPTVSGTGEPGATVAVSVDGTAIGTTVVDPDGGWSIAVGEPLADGEHAVEATQADAAGNGSASDSVVFEVDTAAPAAPTIDSPSQGETVVDPTPVVSGTGEPGAVVEVAIDGEPVGTAPVAPDGTWSLPLEEPLRDGPHVIEAVQTDPAGNASPPATVEFEVDAPEPLPAPTILAPVDGTVTNDATPVVSGTGEPGATVTVTVDGVPVGTALVTPEGTWSLTIAPALSDGAHELAATQEAGEGSRSAPSAPVGIVVDTVAPPAPTITAPAHGSTTGPNLVIRGEGEPGATVVVVLDGVEIGTVVVPECTSDAVALAPTCEWTLVVGDEAAAGPHVVEAWQTDAAGNASDTASNEFVVEVGAAGHSPQPGGGSGSGSGGGSGSGAGAGGGELPRTGAELDAGMLALAMLLLLGGAMLHAASRRRHS